MSAPRSISTQKSPIGSSASCSSIYSTHPPSSPSRTPTKLSPSTTTLFRPLSILFLYYHQNYSKAQSSVALFPATKKSVSTLLTLLMSLAEYSLSTLQMLMNSKCLYAQSSTEPCLLCSPLSKPSQWTMLLLDIRALLHLSLTINVLF